MQLHKSSDRGRGVEPFRGQVEVLEGRVLLSCTVKERLGTLTISGTAGADIVRISDGGSNAAGDVRVKCNNGAANALVVVATNVGPINKININTGAGDDFADYVVAAGATLVAPRSVTIKLGSGNNTGKVGADLATVDANLIATVSSGNGKDLISVGAAGGIDPVLGFLPATITAGHTLSVTASAGAGDDKVSLAADQATINGSLVFDAKGAGGVDTLGATAVDAVLGAGGLLSLTLQGGVGADVMDVAAGILAAGAGSQAKISLLGSDHNDKLGLDFVGSAPTLSLLINGGLGTDTCELPVGIGPPQLTVIGCEL